MINMEILEYKVNEYYDNEMFENELYDYEKRISLSTLVKEFTYESCFEFYKISKSINLAKKRSEKYAENLINSNLNKMFECKSLIQRLCRFFSKFQ